MRISLVAAMDEKRGIGKNNKLPWDIPEDLERFRKLTAGHAVIMGRKTYESIGRHLPERISIIITRETNYNPHKFSNCANCDDSKIIICGSVEEAIQKAKEIEPEEIFIIGGGEIFEQAIGMADKLYLTIINGDFQCDTFFPDYSEFKKVIFEENRKSDGLKYKFLELEK